MNFLQFLGAITYTALRKGDSQTLKSSTVEKWISENGNRNNIGRGYAGGSLPKGGSSGFAELAREAQGNIVRVTATIVFDQRVGPFARKTWETKKLDAKLEKMFGNNLRFRINV